MIRPKPVPYQRRRQNSTGNNFAKTNSNMSNAIAAAAAAQHNLPLGTVLLAHQVAGHTFQDGKDDVGMLKDEHDGSILKPAYKKLCGQREIQFYEQLQCGQMPNSVLLKELVPEYRGTVRMKLGERSIDFIRLADVTHDMTEPCVIDIKIGQRTWDPLASADKIAAEEQKYQSCKKNLGICIPGFQVYSVKSGAVKRYGKEYGKKLNETTIKDALKIFLNADHGLCRPLLVQFLSGLWNIQKWSRSQTALRLYSSSILLVYDARCLRNTIESQRKGSSNNGLVQINGSPNTTVRPRRPHTADNERSNSPFFWPGDGLPAEPVEVYKKVQRSHSSQNNYDEDLKQIRENYSFMLDNLIGGDAGGSNKEWAFVKMIDFAHVFPSGEESLDSNYLFGIENLVKIFEQLLKEC